MECERLFKRVMQLQNKIDLCIKYIRVSKSLTLSQLLYKVLSTNLQRTSNIEHLVMDLADTLPWCPNALD